ncbi:hypothetical protein OG440_04210 [Streptomyces sp. NBC_00637]|uniref:hypothetical protein n=1 Tax=Streptomyces sp. NBC_00637 TaxID=2903667 RepID=UPI0032551589
MTSPTNPLTAGAGKAAVHLPSSLFPVDGFTSVHDPLYVRVVVLDDGTTRLALTVIDQTSVFDDQLARTRDILGRVCGVDPLDCLIVASHTFSAPHVPPPERTPQNEREKTALLAEAVDHAVTRAAADAVRTLRPATVGFGHGTCRVGVQRNVRTPHGWWLGADDAGPTDPGLGILRVDGPEGTPVALLLNHAVQSSVMNGSVTRAGERQVGADLAGAATRRIEDHYGDGAVALFLIGAAGDQAPYLTAVRSVVGEDGEPHLSDLHDDGHTLVDMLGERLAAEAVRVGDTIRTTPPATPLKVIHDSVRVPAQVPPAGGPHDLRPATRYAFTPDGTADAPFVVVRIGDAVYAGVQAELNARTGLAVKAASPFPDTCVVTMVNGAAKYMADEGSYERITYTAMNSRYGRGAAEAVAARLGEALVSLRADYQASCVAKNRLQKSTFSGDATGIGP